MYVVTLGGTKGGSSKSTIATNLAVCAAKHKEKVLLIDADVQGTAMAFRGVRESNDIPVMSITTPTLHEDIPSLSFDLIIIDVGGRDSKVLRSAIAAADLVLVPVLPSVYDVWACGDTIELIREVRTYKKVDCRIILSQVEAGTIMAKEALDSLEEYKDEVPMMKSKIYDRAIYKKVVMRGLGVIEAEPKGKAAEEVEALYKEIKSILKKGKK